MMKRKLTGLLFAFTVSTVAAAATGTQPAWQMIGQIGGPTQAVTVQGKYAYLGVGLRVIVLDVTDPTSPREVGSSPPFSDFVRDIAVSGTFAYVAAGGAGLRVLSVSDPTRPEQVGSVQLRGYAEGVAVSGTTVCLADGPYGLRVIDVSNPRSPAEVGFAFSRNYAFKVATDGRYAYVAAAGAGLLIADLTNRAKPSEVATLATPGYAYGVAVNSNTVYVAGGWEGLEIVDVTTKAQPRLLGQYRTEGWAMGISVSGNQVYVAAALGGLRVVDVSDPARPTEVGGIAFVGGDAANVALAGTIAYVADRNWGLEAVDLSTPASPVQVGFYGPLGYADGIMVAGNYAYVAAGPYGLRIVDISDPARARQAGAYDTQSYAKSVAVVGKYAYVGTVGGFQVVDVSDPSRPTRAGVLSESLGTRDLAIAAGVVYIADEWGLRLVDVSDPTAPKQLSFLQIQTSNGQNTTVGVAVSGNVAYVALEQQGLLTVDVSNPSAPAVIGKLQWPDASAQDIVVAHNIAFVADQIALTVLDLSNPRVPVWLASYPTSGFEESLALVGNQIFVANGGAGLSVINVSNPGSPALAWNYRTLDYAESVFVRDDLIFVADSSGGLLILGKPSGGAASLGGVGTPPRAFVSQGVAPMVAPPPVRANVAPIPVAPAVAVQAASSCVVTSNADSGAGTFRACLERANSGTTITFDPVVFPPSHPATIAPLSFLPSLVQGNVTIDASNAGVILDGSSAEKTIVGLDILSDSNSIKGMQIVHFPSAGILLQDNAHNNLIGGSRNRGSGPLGEGNLISGNRFGIQMIGPNVTNTTITGNLIGTDITGTVAMGNAAGIGLSGCPNNRIGGTSPGERNVISGNIGDGIGVGGKGNAIIGNYIGVDATGTKALSNGAQGVSLGAGAGGNFVQGNVIVTTSKICVGINDWGSSYNTIVGNLLGTDPSGKVAVGSAQVAINVDHGASFNRIGGTTPADRNVIAQGGVAFGRQGGPGNLVIGNFIGTDITGSVALAKRGKGIALQDGSNRPFIGGTTAGERNVISGNPSGGIGVGPAADYTFIGGNYIGTDASGRVALGNGGSGGIVISQGTHIIVQGNLIAHHINGAGITVSGYAGNTLRQNLIYDNQGGGIVLEDGGNNGASPPVITSFSATEVSGTACPRCEVEIFSDSGNEGQIFEGSTFADASGSFMFDKGSLLTGPNVTATATDASGNTSAFSPGKAQLNLSLTAGGATVGSTVGSIGTLRAGYAVLNVNSGSTPYGTAVFTLTQNGVVVSEAAVPASPATTAVRVFVDYRTGVATRVDRANSKTVDIYTGLALVNPGTAAANLTLRLRDTSGKVLTTGHLTLAPHAHKALFINELNQVASDFILPSNFATAIGFATLDVTSDQPISTLALRLTATDRKETLLTTTPIVDLTKPLTTTSIFFPHFADGGDYRTALYLMNTSSTVETGTVRFFSNSGTPVALHLTGDPGGASSSFTYSIPIGGCAVLISDGAPSSVNSGSVQVTPSGGTSAPAGAGVFSLAPGGTMVAESGIPSATPTTRARIYVDTSNGHHTGLAIAAPDGTAFHADLNAYLMDGVTCVGGGRVDLVGNGHEAKFDYQFIPSLRDNFTGVLDISSTTPFAALTLRSLINARGEFLFTTFPIADFNQPAPAPVIFPQIADGGGYRTEFILLSSGSGATSTLSFYGDTGALLPIGN